MLVCISSRRCRRTSCCCSSAMAEPHGGSACDVAGRFCEGWAALRISSRHCRGTSPGELCGSRTLAMKARDVANEALLGWSSVRSSSRRYRRTSCSWHLGRGWTSGRISLRVAGQALRRLFFYREQLSTLPVHFVELAAPRQQDLSND